MGVQIPPPVPKENNMSRETRAIANANHILNTLDRFPMADVHTRNNHIGMLKGGLFVLKKGATARRLDALETRTHNAQNWLIECTKKRMQPI